MKELIVRLLQCGHEHRRITLSIKLKSVVVSVLHGAGDKKTRFLKQKVVFLGGRFFRFNLQMPDTKLRPTSTMKRKDKSSEQRFGHVNATNHNSYFNIIFIKLVYTLSKKTI